MLALHYANELLVRVRLSFQKFLQTRSTCRNKKKKEKENVWEKSDDTYSLSIRVQTTLNHISICFYHDINVKENVFFFFSGCEHKKGIARHIDASNMVWNLIDSGKLANQIARLAAIVVKNQSFKAK